MSDDKTARILELEEQLRERNASIRRLDEWTHKQCLAAAEWAKKLADRDAAWERACIEVLGAEHSIMRLHGEPGIDVNRMTTAIKARLDKGD